MKRLIFALCALAVVASVAYADVPDQTKCACTLDTAQRLVIVPGTLAGTAFTVTVRNSSNNPINNALVEVLIGGQTDSKTHLCNPSTIQGNTNASGIVTFNIGGGGCYKGAGACVIRANGSPIREYLAVMSPDYAGTDNSGVAGRWNMAVNLADFSSFNTSYTNVVASCHDYDNGGTTNISDFAVFVQCYTKSCTP